MTILEPMTLITDWLLAAQCLVLAARLLTVARRSGARSQRLLAGALLSTALAATLGGAAHGFAAYLSAVATVVIWKATVFSIGVTAFLFLAAAAVATLSRGPRRAVIVAGLVQAGIYAGWMLFHDAFLWVIVDYVPAMLAVAVLMIAARRTTPGARWIAAGVLVSFLGAGIQAAGLAPHPHFNHNDLYHVVQMIATWLLYRGGLQLRDRRG